MSEYKQIKQLGDMKVGDWFTYSGELWLIADLQDGMWLGRVLGVIIKNGKSQWLIKGLNVIVEPHQ